MTEDEVMGLSQMAAHTVLGIRHHENSLDSWWFKLGGNLWFLIANDSVDISLTTQELVETHPGDLFWIESLPLGLIGAPPAYVLNTPEEEHVHVFDRAEEDDMGNRWMACACGVEAS